MIHIISSKHIISTGKITYRYMFDIENGFDIDKIISLPYGYFWNEGERYILNLFKSGDGLIFGVGGEIEDLKHALDGEEIPDCSVLSTHENAVSLARLLEEKGIEFGWYKHSEDYLRTSD